MLQKLIAILCITAILALYASAEEKGKKEEGFKIGDPAPKFTLKDAYDKEHSLELISRKDEENRKAVILIMGDRKVREEANKWAKELHKIYEKNEEVALLMVADLRDLPFFVTESMVKWGTKRENLPIPIVLDWGGKVNESYKAKRSKPNLYIIDKEGKVAFHQVGKYSEELIKKIQAKVQESLKKDSPKEE
jgi:peroxiredoxin